MPVTSAVRRGVQSATSRATASNPTVWSLDERMIEPVVLDHQVQNAVEQRRIASRLDRQEQVAGPRDRRDARIDDDDFRAVLARLPDIVGGDRRALGDVGAADQDRRRRPGCRSKDWRPDRCQTPFCCRPRRSPCTAGRCSRCSRCAGTCGRTCPSGRFSRWSGWRRDSTANASRPCSCWMRSISPATRADRRRRTPSSESRRRAGSSRRRAAADRDGPLQVALHALRAQHAAG